MVSIITIVYNDVSNILQTMESVLSQSYQSIEYIVIDGGSTDGTVDVIRSKANQIAYWTSERDRGIYDAMNKGITRANGEWILFMNSGDSFFSERVVEDIFNTYVDRGESFICGDTNLIDRRNGSETVAKAYFVGFKKFMPSFHQSIFTRTYELKAHPFSLSYKLLSDYAFFYDLYQRNPNSKYIPLIVSNYDISGVSSVNLKLRAREFMRLFFRKKSKYFFFWFAVYVKKIVFKDR